MSKTLTKIVRSTSADWNVCVHASLRGRTFPVDWYSEKGGHPFGLLAGAGATHCKLRKITQNKLGTGPRRTLMRTNPQKKATSYGNCFFREFPVRRLLRFSRESFEIPGNPEFCSFCSASSFGEQKKSQNERSGDVASKWRNVDGCKRSRIRRSYHQWYQPRWSCTGKQAEWMPS